MRIGRLGAVVVAVLVAGAQPPKKAAGPLDGRKEAERAKTLKDAGGTEESERAVEMGLVWLAKQQKQDGGWEFDAGSKDERVAATGLALLAFLGAGETHTDKCKYQKTVAAGVAFLVKAAPGGGGIGKPLSKNAYAHGIGTLALVEAYLMTRDKALLAPAQGALNHVIAGQAANGSWGYTPGAAGDTSITGWQVQALHAARLSRDFVVPAATVKKTAEFLDAVGAGKLKARYGYSESAGAAPGTSLTAIGLLCRHRFDGWAADHDGMAEGVKGLMKKAPVKTAAVPDTYFYYYATQVVRTAGGDEWATWNEGPKGADGGRKGGMRDWLVLLQLKKDGPNQGSFDPDPGHIGRSCGRLGTTALAVLTLEVYYRYPLPR
ncbi:prenyltransferase/squalene oxidase repeat-containing protein [Gemmata sp.]|uniref:prenyltransferase/squalene oxidase repeat-containing protein n=1 Tax=Gemmata sp. TaxID=1914242 RepID=UPI003F6F81DA